MTRDRALEQLQMRTGYRFRDTGLAAEALRHSSCNIMDAEGHRSDNERLEFIGDACLDLIIGTELYEALPHKPEGFLTRLRSQLVCERNLSLIGRGLGLGELIEMGAGEEKSGGRENASIIADCLEAVIGAVYSDGGFEKARVVIRELFGESMSRALSGGPLTDCKTALQEAVLAEGHELDIKYVTDRSEGPDHDKTFYVHVESDGRILGRGVGKSKKEAEQRAAEEALKKGC